MDNLFYLIPAIIIAISFVVLLVILLKKLPQVTSLNTETIPKEKATRVKNRIMIDRINRNYIAVKKKVSTVTKPISKKVVQRWDELYNRAIQIEKETIKDAQPLKSIDLHQDIKEKLSKIEELVAAEELDQAEETGIEIIEVDPENLEAYYLLSDVYQKKRDLRKARETLRYLLKLATKKSKQKNGEVEKHQLANYYADLGYVYQQESKPELAKKNYQLAVDLEPNNPRFLDLLLKISIMLKDKTTAQKIYTDMEAADPDNNKLSELKEEIDNLPS